MKAITKDKLSYRKPIAMIFSLRVSDLLKSLSIEVDASAEEEGWVDGGEF